MTEITQVRQVASRCLSPYGLMLRVEDKLGSGVPDFHYVLRSVPGWLECKIIHANGRCPDHFTREQLMWGEEYMKAGGRWYLLGLMIRTIPRTWRLYNSHGARAWFDGVSDDLWLFNLSGPFPTRTVLDKIAPLPQAAA